MTLAWPALLAASIFFDVLATAYLRVAGERVAGLGYFLAATAGLVIFAPSIVAFGYALRAGPSYLATVGVWVVGILAGNALIGIVAFGDRLDLRTALGIAAACLTVLLLRSAR
jgi:multidrug transporter EmrE-like cation transporter